jgi:SMI1 / KNR4 family (SUKH-1)
MTEADLELIERELGITLPDSYKRALVPFPIPALVGNTDYQLWDDAPALIKLNRDLRKGANFRPAWPLHFFAVGDPHGDELIAIDLRDPNAPVWWLDHGLVDSKASYQSHTRFTDWLQEFNSDLRSDLKGDGYNPDGTPERLKADQDREMKRGYLGCLALLLLAVVALAVHRFFRH